MLLENVKLLLKLKQDKYSQNTEEENQHFCIDITKDRKPGTSKEQKYLG